MTHRGGARFPKSSPETRDHLRTLVPDDPRVTVRPMFGGVSAFADGQMFMGVLGEQLFVRLGEPDRASVNAAGGAPFEPMPGRPMREYVTIPDWRSDEQTVRRWAAVALDYALSLPPKKK